MTHKISQWRSLGRVLLYLFGCAFVLALTASLPLARRGPAQDLFIGSIASLGSFALTILFVRWDGLRLRDVGAMPNSKSPGLLAIGFLLGLSLVALHSYFLGVAGHVHWVRASGARADQAGLILLGYLFLSAREELAFHGYPLRRLQNRFGVWGAQAMIAAAFALEHIAGGWPYAQALWGAATGSVLFGMASIATRGLAVPIGIHAAWNIGDWVRGNRAEVGLWRPEIETGFAGAASWAGIWCYVAVMALATLGFWSWHRARRAADARDA
jgi:membrane protease YdiL (CAAX protease family)